MSAGGDCLLRQAVAAPVVREESIHLAQVMRLTVSCDHRIIEGAAARFLKDVTAQHEAPDDLVGGEV